MSRKVPREHNNRSRWTKRMMEDSFRAIPIFRSDRPPNRKARKKARMSQKRSFREHIVNLMRFGDEG